MYPFMRARSHIANLRNTDIFILSFRYSELSYTAYAVQLSESFLLYLLDGGFVLPPDDVSPLTSPTLSSLDEFFNDSDQDDEGKDDNDDKARQVERAEGGAQAGDSGPADDEDEIDDKDKPFHGMPGFDNVYDYLKTYHEEERPALCGPSRARDHLRDNSPWAREVTTPTSSSSEDCDEVTDPSIYWRAVHYQIEEAILRCRGRALPKLNWSAPKDATHMNFANSMECLTPNDVYLLLKSSDFVTHDLTECFSDCVDKDERFTGTSIKELTYHVILRKKQIIVPSMEFRIFIRNRTIIGISQRDARCHYDFLAPMAPDLKRCLIRFFEKHVRHTFADENFTLDVYVEDPDMDVTNVKIIDFNPWAKRTDPLLFSWMELLTMEKPTYQDEEEDHSTTDSSSGSDEDIDPYSEVELRLIKQSDPEAWNMSTPAYSAHKLPRDVVDVTQSGDGGEGMRELLQQWRDLQTEGGQK